MGDPATYPSIILFDGFCNLCSGSVDFIIQRDRKKIFRFVALQSESGIFLRKKFALPEETDSVILWQNGRFYFYSEAALIIAKHLNNPWPVLWIFNYVPIVVRDGIYKWIARNRYKWFGTRQVCRMPVGEERRLFPSVADLQFEMSGLEPSKEV